MLIDILTIFPDMFISPLSESILKRAQEKKLVTINAIDIRDFSTDKHRRVDDYPFGGGAGMVMKPEPIFSAWKSVTSKTKAEKRRTILLCPQGRKYNQNVAKELLDYEHLIFICGHYEGIDERVRQHLVDDEISIGDFILTGGELPAMVLIDSIVRLIPGVLGSFASTEQESFANGLLEYPQYTRPSVFNGYTVPDILLSGNHKLIKEWREEQSLLRTKQRRPDLLKE